MTPNKDLERLLEMHSEGMRDIDGVQDDTRLEYQSLKSQIESKLVFCDKQLEAFLIVEPQFKTFKDVMNYILKLQRDEMQTEAKRLNAEQELSQLRPIVQALRDWNNELDFNGWLKKKIESILASSEVKQ